MHKPRLFVAAAATISLAGTAAWAQTCNDLGVPVNGHPNYQERAVHVLTNAVRLSPQQYRDEYLGSAPILTPSAYPAVGPLSWSHDLNQAARFHAQGLATPGCAFSHTSCDGTPWNVRIGSFYNLTQNVGENIAGGQTSPLNAVNAWLLDNTPSGPAPDGSSGDGHRRNIMRASYQAVGHGYATGANTYGRYWVQDFGGVIPTDARCRPVPSASHIVQGSTVSFLANYYDENNQPPQSALVVINGSASPMSVHLGTAARGTYRLQSPSTGGCRSYHFEFRTASGALVRYPARGELRTTTEGGCSETYVAGSAPCAADFDGSGGAEVGDIFAFLTAWFGGSSSAEFDSSAGITVSDIFAFLTIWFAGCP